MAKVVRFPLANKEFYRVPVSAQEAGVPADPTTLVPRFALMASGAPSSWTTGEWETDATQTPPIYYARITIGGTGSGAAIAVAVGTYTAWLNVVGATESPVRQVGQVEVF